MFEWDTTMCGFHVCYAYPSSGQWHLCINPEEIGSNIYNCFWVGIYFIVINYILPHISVISVSIETQQSRRWPCSQQFRMVSYYMKIHHWWVGHLGRNRCRKSEFFAVLYFFINQYFNLWILAICWDHHLVGQITTFMVALHLLNGIQIKVSEE